MKVEQSLDFRSYEPPLDEGDYDEEEDEDEDEGQRESPSLRQIGRD